MKLFKPHYLAIFPLLSLVSFSPSKLMQRPHYRHMASVEVSGSKHPLYEARVAKINKEALLKPSKLTTDSFKAKLDKLCSKVELENKEFKKNQSDKDVVSKQKDKIESLIIDLHLVELEFAEFKTKNEMGQEDKSAAENEIAQHKNSAESLLEQLSINEALAEKPKEEKSVVVVTSPEVKTEAVNKAEDENKKKVEEARLAEISRQEKLICDLQDKNNALSTQLSSLMNDQNDIMKTIVGLSQMMVQMSQNQQNQAPMNPYSSNWFAFQQSPYQYNQPVVNGNWIYHANGNGPSQPSIFAAPQGQQAPQQQQQGFYPDQTHQYKESNWNLRPQNYFNDPRYNTEPLIIGGFGTDNISYNFSPSSSPNSFPL